MFDINHSRGNYLTYLWQHLVITSQNRIVTAIIATSLMILPFTILRGIIVWIGSTAEPYDLLTISHGAKELSDGILFIIPLFANVFFAIHWAIKNRLSPVSLVTTNLINIMLFNFFFSRDSIFVTHISLPAAIFSAIVTCLFFEKVNLYLSRKKIENVIGINLKLLLKIALSALLAMLISLFAKPFVEVFYSLAMSYSEQFYPTDFLHGLLYGLAKNIFWLFGVNGHHVFYDTSVAFTNASAEMMRQWHLDQLHQVELHILSNTFYDVWCGIGGAGNTLSLILAIYLSKQGQYKKQGRIYWPFAMFNVNEPLIFGMPVAFNPIMALPFLLVPLVGYVLAYCATSMGLLPLMQQQVSWLTPPLFNAWLATDGAWNAVVGQAIIIVLGTLIYLPFLNALEKGLRVEGLLDSLQILTTVKYPVDQDTNPHYKHIAETSKQHVAQQEIEKLNRSGQFTLYFQPQIDLATTTITGFEALIRHRGHDGKITPPFFLNAYAQLGYMPEIDFWVLEQALKQINSPEWACNHQPKSMAINISPQTLLDSRFLPIVDALLVDPLPSNWHLEFEITESQKLANINEVKAILQVLRQRQIKIALDDFGSGYSTLSYLTYFEFDKIKIDRSLVLGLANKDGYEFLSNVTKLCTFDKTNILIEGVETDGERVLVSNAGISSAQGFLFYKPLPAAEIATILQQEADLIPTQRI